MDKEDARYQKLGQLHERRKQVVRLHVRCTGVMQIVTLTGLSYPTVRKAIDLFEAGGWQALKPAARGRNAGDGRLLSASLGGLDLIGGGRCGHLASLGGKAAELVTRLAIGRRIARQVRHGLVDGFEHRCRGGWRRGRSLDSGRGLRRWCGGDRTATA